LILFYFVFFLYVIVFEEIENINDYEYSMMQQRKKKKSAH